MCFEHIYEQARSLHCGYPDRGKKAACVSFASVIHSWYDAVVAPSTVHGPGAVSYIWTRDYTASARQISPTQLHQQRRSQLEHLVVRKSPPHRGTLIPTCHLGSQLAICYSTATESQEGCTPERRSASGR